jgi:hypothetical protein
MRCLGENRRRPGNNCGDRFRHCHENVGAEGDQHRRDAVGPGGIVRTGHGAEQIGGSACGALGHDGLPRHLAMFLVPHQPVLAHTSTTALTMATAAPSQHHLLAEGLRWSFAQSRPLTPSCGNLRRGHYEITVDLPVHDRVRASVHRVRCLSSRECARRSHHYRAGRTADRAEGRGDHPLGARRFRATWSAPKLPRAKRHALERTVARRTPS